MTKPLSQLRNCFNCGKPIGTYVDWDPLDHCGDDACKRAAKYARDAERAEAHDKLDRDMGY